MSLYTEAPGIYCNGDGCCKTYEVGVQRVTPTGDLDDK